MSPTRKVLGLLLAVAVLTLLTVIANRMINNEPTETAATETVERPEVSPEPSPTAPPSGEPAPEKGAPSIDDIYFEQTQQYAREQVVDWPFGRDNLIELVAAASDVDTAERAVDSLGIDWEAKAVESAEYLLGSQDIGSRADLLRELASYGYTQEQAEHAAKAVGF